MTASQSVPPTRPRAVNIAFWVSIAGAVLLVAGGLLGIFRTFGEFRTTFVTSVTDDQVRQILTMHRATGVVYVIVGLVLALLAGRTRKGDTRFRRALVALSVLVVVLLAAAMVFLRIVLELPAVLAVIPIAIGATLFTRPSAAAWFGAEQEQLDG
jgi:heme A synthase